ncbi:MAG: hypothetical protein AAGK97_09340, partial [Bacteroidota bacterium]
DLAFIFYLIKNEKVPTGKEGPAAEALTDKMFQAINKSAWETTPYITWNFADRNQYVWDKINHNVEVRSGTSRVLLNTKRVDGIAYDNEVEVTGDKANKLIQKAWSNFCNDSFWLNAPSKARDPGTSRYLVNTKDGKEALMIKYNSGGVTPGDTYLWFLDETGLPTSYKMWVKIIPIGGVEWGWNDWLTLNDGAKVSSLHKGLFDIQIKDLKAGNTLQELGAPSDLFAKL